MDWLTGLFDWVWSLLGMSENKTVQVVREKTVELCGFLPTVETVVALLAVNNPAAVTAVVIAKKICTAVTRAKMVTLTGAAPIIVDGVVIEGDFVNKGEK
jgi:hypothetical protein